MDALTIREAVPDDAEAIIAYLNQVGGESDNLLFGENEFHLTVGQEYAMIEGVRACSASVMLLGIVEETIVSVGLIQSPKRKRVAHTADLSVSVKKRWWNHGIGRRMVGQLLAFARGNGITRLVQLTVRADNHGAIKLYREAGFEHVGRIRDAMRIGDEYFDTVIMCRYL